MGLSRRRELYYKEIVFDSLAELFLEYKRSYERVFHTLKRVKARAPTCAVCYASFAARPPAAACLAECVPLSWSGGPRVMSLVCHASHVTSSCCHASHVTSHLLRYAWHRALCLDIARRLRGT